MISVEKYFEGVASLELMAKHEVGQNFLVDASVAERIVGLLEEKEGEHILEIGCGAGSLSYFLAAKKNEVDLIDIDEGMLAKVSSDFAGEHNVHPQYGNAAKWDYSSYDLIIGNLPYYITSLIIEAVLLNATKARRLVFMVQKEAAMRLLAEPKTKEYGPLPILIRLRGKMRRAFNVPRSCFAPAPHVDSSVLVIDLFPNQDKGKIAKTYGIANSLFLQRRKTIYNNLKALTHDGQKATEILDKLRISPSARPEELTPDTFLSLAEECGK